MKTTRVIGLVIAVGVASLCAVEPADAIPPVVIEQPTYVRCLVVPAISVQTVGRIAYGTGSGVSLCDHEINFMLLGVNIAATSSTQVSPGTPRAAQNTCDDCDQVLARTAPPLEAFLPTCFDTTAGVAWGQKSRQVIEGTPVRRVERCMP